MCHAMFETFATIQRPNTDGKCATIATHVGVQVDQMSLQEGITHQAGYNFSGTVLYEIITLGWYPTALIKRGEELRDEFNTDPEFGVTYVYRVIGSPKDFQFDHH